MKKKFPKLNRRAPNKNQDTLGSERQTESERATSVDEQSEKRAGSNNKTNTADNRSLQAMRPNLGAIKKLEAAIKTVQHCSNWARAGGLIPLPFVEVPIVIGIQLKMLRDLCEIYRLKYKKSQAQPLLVALISSVLPAAAGKWLTMSLAKSMPVIGIGIGMTASMILSGATTHAAGIVFIRHFENGGTLENFDVTKNLPIFQKEFKNTR